MFNSKWFKTVLFLAMAVIMVLGPLGCAAPEPTKAPEKPAAPAATQPPAATKAPELKKVTMRVGRIPQAQGMTPVTEVMKRDKLIETAGKEFGLDIKVEWSDFPGGAPIRQGLTGGQLDIGSVGNTPTIIGLAQGEPLRILSLAEGRVKFVLALPSGSKITTPEQIKNQKVGVMTGSDLQFFFDLFLQTTFGTTDYKTLGIEVVKITTLLQGAVPPEGLVAGTTTETSYLVGQKDKLNTGLVNSYGYTEANYDGPLGKGAGIELPERKKSPYYPEGLYLHRNFWLTTEKYAKDEPKAISAFLVAQQRALTTLSKMKSVEVADMVKDIWGMPGELSKTVWENDLDSRRAWGWLTEGDLRAVVDQSALMVQSKLIEKPITWKMVMDNIAPLNALSKEAWQVVKFPEAGVFTDKNAQDLRGNPTWESDKWELPKKTQ